jgi:chaperonin GroEL (HSP60 family)
MELKQNILISCFQSLQGLKKNLNVARAKTQNDMVGDGTTTVVVLAAELLKKAARVKPLRHSLKPV